MRFPGRFPLKFGGHDDTQDVEHQALLDALAPGWDVEEDTELWIETRVDALALTMIWIINRRAGNQAIPTRMQEVLADWEAATNLRPASSDTLIARRRALSAKLRGIVANALDDIEDAAATAMGANFVALVQVAEADWISYWPGINPGPPGYEFSSNRAHICIHCNRNGLTDAEFVALRTKLINTLLHLVPVWMRFTIGLGSGVGTTHVCNVGIVGATII